MIPDKRLAALKLPGSPYHYSPAPLEQVHTFLRWRREVAPAEQWDQWLVPTCRCCGEVAWDNLRCTKHQDRNPCVVEGCTRTMPARGWLRDDAFLCGEHWRVHCPPGSPIRKAFNRLGRLARRMGYRRHDRWPDQLQERRWRLWQGLVRRIQRGDPEGHIDQAAIERMFGWADD